jgi:hypothetical protein
MLPSNSSAANPRNSPLATKYFKPESEEETSKGKLTIRFVEMTVESATQATRTLSSIEPPSHTLLGCKGLWGRKSHKSRAIIVPPKRLLSPTQAPEAFPFLSTTDYLDEIRDPPCRFFAEGEAHPRIEVVIVAHT